MSNEHKDHLTDDKYEEEYSAEFTPAFHDYSLHRDTGADASTAIKVIGYVGLFVALFSLGFSPVLFGTIGVVIGIFTVLKHQKTLGYTTIVFGAISILFTLFVS